MSRPFLLAAAFALGTFAICEGCDCEWLVPRLPLSRPPVSTQIVNLKVLEPEVGQVPKADRRHDEHVLRALNKIRKPSTAEEITELLNRDLSLGDRPFQASEIAAWLRNPCENVLRLYWLETRPRR